MSSRLNYTNLHAGVAQRDILQKSVAVSVQLVRLWKLTLAYDGTPFHGWQVQPGLATIQGMLAAALNHVTGESVLPQGSGRTDTGVHALAQVASFPLAAPIPPANLQRALNRALPASIRVLSAEYAPAFEDEAGRPFHARHSALQKTYEYRIFPRTAQDDVAACDQICPPTLAPFVWDCPWVLDLQRLQRAAALVLGEHDFTSFAASDPDRAKRYSPETAKSAVRTLFHSYWELEAGILRYRVAGSGFLHHMVRNLVGTFVDCAAGRVSPEAIGQILAARDRAAAGPTAPARGLFLVSVLYPEPAAPC